MKSLKGRFSQAVLAIRGNSATNSNGDEVPPMPNMPISKETEDVAGPRFHGPLPATEGQREAGDPVVYSDTPVCFSFYQVSSTCINTLIAPGISVLGQRHDS